MPAPTEGASCQAGLDAQNVLYFTTKLTFALKKIFSAVPLTQRVSKLIFVHLDVFACPQEPKCKWVSATDSWDLKILGGFNTENMEMI